MRQFSIRLSGVCACLAIIALGGCSSGDSNFPASVKGKVTYAGNPVGGGTITFHGADGVPYTTYIGVDGSYDLPSLTEGTMTITVETESINPDRKKDVYNKSTAGSSGIMGKYGKGGRPKPSGGGGGKGVENSPAPDGSQSVEPTYVKIPGKYKDKATSPLSFTLKKGSQTHNVELTD